MDARTGESEWSARLEAKALTPAEIEMRPGARFPAERVSLSDPNKLGRSWTRYSIDYPVPEKQRRAHKATGKMAALSVALSERSEPGILAAGMPLDFANSLPVSLNAQFDPDLARRGVRERRWNKWLFDRLAELVSGVASLRFQRDVRTGWQAVPLDEENAGDEEWTESRISDFIETVHDRVRSRVRLEIDGEDVRLEDLSYLGAGLEKVLSEDDQRLLASDHIPLPRKFCGRQGRWRLVLDALGEGLRLEADDALS